MSYRTLFCAAALALVTAAGAPAATPPAAVDGGPKLEDTGEFCIPLNRIRDSDVLDNETILLRLVGRDNWRKLTLENRCSGLLFSGFTISTSFPELCRSDLLRVNETAGSVCTIDRIERLTTEQARALQRAN